MPPQAEAERYRSRRRTAVCCSPVEGIDTAPLWWCRVGPARATYSCTKHVTKGLEIQAASFADSGDGKDNALEDAVESW